MNRIAGFAVKYPVTVMMLALGVVLLGFISFGKLGTDLFPDLNNPRIYIEIKAGEKPPEEIEKNYVDRIESLAMRQNGVIEVSSSTKVGKAVITVEYDWKKDMDEAFLDLQKELNSFVQNSDLEDFVMSRFDPNAEPVMIVALKNERITNLDELRKVAENYIRNELVRIDGIADVRLSGVEESEIVVETNKYILESYGITSDAIAAQINNYNRNVSGGSIVEMGTRYVVKGVSVLKDLPDIGNIIVGFKQLSASSAAASSTSSRVPVYLRDVAKIYLSNKEPENIVTINGEKCIGLSVYKEPKFNTVEAVKKLKEAFINLSRALPGYEFVYIQDQGKYIRNAITEVQNTALLGILLAVAVIYVFLRRIGSTLVISTAIPLSIIATFNLMYFNHLTINIMTLGGLALGAGMLVDSAIVVIENITRNREEGLSLKDAAVTGTGQVGGAITASVITTIVVFLPIVYIHGASGELFKDQALTVAFSLLSSLLVALVVIPMLVTAVFREKDTATITAPVKFGWYKRWLEIITARRWLVLITTFLITAATALLIPFLGSEFMPRAESAGFTINLKLPQGTSLERTFQTTAGAENIIRSLLGEKISMIYSQSGSTGTSYFTRTDVNEGENNASLKVILKEEYAAESGQAMSMIESILKNIPDVEISFSREETALQSSLGTTGSPFALEIAGEDFSEIEKIMTQAKDILSGIGGLYNLTTSFDEGTPEVDVTIDRLKTSYYSLTAENVATQVRSYLSGASAGSFEKDGEMKDITIRLEKIPLNQLKDLMINAGNSRIPLSELARIEIVTSPKEIIRRNQTRTGYIYAMVRGDEPFDHLIKKSIEKLKQIPLPPGYQLQFTGEEIKRKESMANLTFALILAIVLVYMVLAAQFESLIQPFIIMLTIPFAGAGTILLFLLLGKPLNMMAYIGIIMLGGIAVNNAIILVDRINQLKASGLNRKEAIITAGSQRIRPIIMTSLTTILALLPLTIGIGESASLRSPMALAVIGGLITSTILTLAVIPCAYWVADVAGEYLTGKNRPEQIAKS